MTHKIGNRSRVKELATSPTISKAYMEPWEIVCQVKIARSASSGMVRMSGIPLNKIINNLFQENQVQCCTYKKNLKRVRKRYFERHGELKLWREILFNSKSLEQVLLVCCMGSYFRLCWGSAGDCLNSICTGFRKAFFNTTKWGWHCNKSEVDKPLDRLLTVSVRAHHECRWSTGINRLPAKKYLQVMHPWLRIIFFPWVTTDPGMDLKILRVPAGQTHSCRRQIYYIS